jgi:hypothetical protein
MPYALPRDPRQQQAWNDQLSEAYASTRRVDPEAPPAAPNPAATLEKLAELHEAGALTDDEFTAAKARVLDAEPDSA